MNKKKLGRMVKFLFVSLVSASVALLSVKLFFYLFLVSAVLVWMYAESDTLYGEEVRRNEFELGGEEL